MATSTLTAALLLPLSGCPLLAHADASTGIPCSAGPIILAQDDVLSDATARQIVALDRAGARICGWQAAMPTDLRWWKSAEAKQEAVQLRIVEDDDDA